MTDHTSPAFGHSREESRAKEGALARSRRTDESEEMRPAELFPHRLHFELSAEEVLRILLGERGQSWVWTYVFSAFHLKRDFF